MQPIPNKITLKHIGTDLLVIIPAEKNPKFLFFSTLWFVAWFVIYKFASQSEEVFVQIWLIGWTMALFFMVFFLLWFLFGTEQLRISQSQIILSIVLFGLKLNRIIEKREFKGCLYSEEKAIEQNQKKSTFYLTSPAKIKVSSHYKDYFIGSALDDAEAKDVARIVNERIN